MHDDVPEMTPTELKARLDRGDRVTIVDVREPWEWEIGNLGSQGARLIPLNDLPSRMDELNPEDELVMQCRSGGRSAHAAGFLREQGFGRVHNLAGGILRWSDEVDPSIPKY
jgi:adenylyltransferase/sulfurtransferase